jgi:hypothetical protein
MGELWGVYEEDTFFSDCRLIHSRQSAFDGLFHGIKEVLERGNFSYARPLDETGVYWVMSSLPYFHLGTDASVPTLHISFEIVSRPPNGEIALRRVVTEADVQAGLHPNFLADA